MRVDILSLFPEMFAGPFDASIIARARAAGLLEIAVHNPRDYAAGAHRAADDYAYGGGPGMVMKPEPVFDCVDAVQRMAATRARVVLLTPQGRLLNHDIVAELAAAPRLILICGHYEGVDERVREFLADDEISIGDYVLSGGEPAAIVLTDAVARHLPGVLGSDASLAEESHAQGLLEYPQYTRPAAYRGHAVPEILLSGNHAEIARWRREQSIVRTARRRPALLSRATLSRAEARLARVATGATVPAEPDLFRVILPVDDIDRAAAFYATLFDMPGERISGARHDFRCGSAILACADPHDGRPDAESRPDPHALYFAVRDLAAHHARAKAAGCRRLDARIRTRDRGERSFCARDPFDNPICLVDETTVFIGERPAR